MTRFMLMTSVLAMLLAQFGCRHSAGPNVVGAIRVLFEGFVFAGTESQLSAADFGAGVPRAAVPARFEYGQTYVFYLPRQAADLGAWTSVRTRLLSVGAEIVNGPNTGSDLVQLTTGGPMFEFRFRYRGRSGFIRNELEPRIMKDERLSRMWLLEKYLVRLDR